VDARDLPASLCPRQRQKVLGVRLALSDGCRDLRHDPTGFGLSPLHYGRELNSMDQVIGIMFVIVLIGLLADRSLSLGRFLQALGDGLTR
jgi:hypothetical protein